jgi:hypothetical protein
MSKRTLNNSKFVHDTPIKPCCLWKNIQGEKRQRMSFRPQRWHVPHRKHETSSEKLWFVRSLDRNLFQIGQKNYHTCWCHFMTPCQVSWISDELWIYRNLKTKFLNVCGRSTTPRCLKFIFISCMGPKHAPKDTYMIFQPILVHWSMCMYFKFELCTLYA